MIKEKCFTEEWLDQFKKQKVHRRIDKIILEKMIYALHLLERLKWQKQKFTELQRGIKAFDFGFLMSGNFRVDDAISAAARIAFLATKILMNDLSPITYYEGQYLRDWNIENPDWNFLNKLKKQPDKSSFYYWFQTAQLLRIK